MKKIKLDKIPSIFKNVDLPTEVNIKSKIEPKEGNFLAVESLENDGKNDVLEFKGGRLGKLVQGDIIPAVLGYRKAPVEFAGVVPKKIKPKDELTLLCESGLVGELSGVYEAWGKPMRVKVLGSIVDAKGNTFNLRNFKLPQLKQNNKKIPIICFLSTRMDTGKTTAACKITHYFRNMGKRVAAIKPTGVAFCQDPLKLQDFGADPVFDFMDMGLASTCNGDKESVINSSLNLLNHVKQKNPDLILMEFGEGILSEYHVADILQHKQIKNQLSLLILAANDFSGIHGSIDLLNKCKLKIDLVTGPIANSHLGVELIKKYFNLEAESNQHKMSKTFNLINKKLFKNSN